MRSFPFTASFAKYSKEAIVFRHLSTFEQNEHQTENLENRYGRRGRGGVVHCNRKFAESYTTIGRLAVQNSQSILSDLGDQTSSRGFR